MANKKKKKKTNQSKPNQNRPITNPELKKALEELKAARTPANEVKLFEALSNAKLLAPVIFSADLRPDQNGRINMPSNTGIKYVLINTDQNKTFFPAFTDFDEARKLPIDQEGNLQYIVRTIRDYARMFMDANNAAEGLAVNPKSDGMFLPKELIRRLTGEGEKPKEPVQESKLKNGTVPENASFSEPATYPTALANEVYEQCRSIPEISRVWLKQMNVGIRSAFALIVEADKKDKDLLDRVAELAVPFARDRQVVSFYYSEDLENKAVRGDFPLYDRELEI